MPGNVSATSNRNVDSKKTEEKRPSFEAITEDALSDSQLSASGKAILKVFLAWVKNTANPTVRKAITSRQVTQKDFKIYKKAFNEARAEACRQNPPSRASFEKIIGKALKNRGLSAPGRKVLSAFLQWVRNTGNPVVKRAVLSLGQKDYKIYRRCFYKAARKACGEVFIYRQKYGPDANKLMRAEVSAGFTSAALKNLRKKMGKKHPALLPEADNAKGISIDIDAGSRHRPIQVWNPNEWFALGINGQVNVNYNTKKSTVGGLGAGANLIFSPIRALEIDVFGHLRFAGADYEDPSRQHFNGHSTTVTGGLAVSGKWRSGSVKVFGEYQHAENRYDKQVYGFPFKGNMDAGNVGVIVNQNFESKHAPDMWAEIVVTPGGRILLPIWDENNGLTATRYSRLRGAKGKVTAQWRRNSWKPYVSVETSYYSQEHRKPIITGGVEVGIENKKVGMGSIRYYVIKNPTLYSPEAGDTHAVPVRYHLPWANYAVFVEPAYFNIGGKSGASVRVGLDVTRLGEYLKWWK